MADALLPGKLVVDTKLGEDMSTSRGLFLEMFMTAELVLTILMVPTSHNDNSNRKLAAEKHKGTFLAPVGIGLSLFVIMLVGTPYTGSSVNPARSFGPAVVEHSFPIYHWIYWLGPALGAFLAAGFYKFIKVFIGR
jgi:aquaporin rerated protein, other eukaryote